jgi:hypothetical protein
MIGHRVDTMANPEHLKKLGEGSEAWNNWVEEHPEAIVDLRNADFSHKTLSGAYLSAANLKHMNLAYARLVGVVMPRADLEFATLNAAYLPGSNLAGSDLRGADLRASDLSRVRLDDANLDSADLGWASLNQTILARANFTRVKLRATVFADNDLSTVNGLETVQHLGPSTIGIDTIYRSKGAIPESFLRGCGVPDEFIVFAKSLITSPIQFYSCFISYSTKDQDFADRLYADLQNKGVRCWFAPHDIQSGKKLHEQIDEAIRLHDKLLLILSPHSMQSEWVKTEIAKARKRELRDQRRVLFPIRLATFETLRDWEYYDADTGKDSAREIREYFIPDFSHWKNHDSYQEAFQRLLTDLKASDAKPK